MSVSKLKTIPAGYRVKETASGSYLVRKSRSSGKRKLSKRQRMAISKAAKKFKLPVLTLGANMVPLSLFGSEMIKTVSVEPWHRTEQLIKSANALTSAYTGVTLYYDSHGKIQTGFDFDALRIGLLPNLIVYGINKLGVFKSLNRTLAKSHLPVRLK